MSASKRDIIALVLTVPDFEDLKSLQLSLTPQNVPHKNVMGLALLSQFCTLVYICDKAPNKARVLEVGYRRGVFAVQYQSLLEPGYGATCRGESASYSWHTH